MPINRPLFDSVQLVQVQFHYGYYGIYNELVTGAFVNQLITGGPHIVCTVNIYILYIYIYVHTIIYVENDGKPMDLGIHYVQTNQDRP